MIDELGRDFSAPAAARSRAGSRRTPALSRRLAEIARLPEL